MPSPHERHRNNIRAGVWVTIALALALGVIIVLSDAVSALSGPDRAYTVVFDVSAGVGTLRRGADVRIGGYPMGEVRDIQPRLSPNEPFEQIEIAFALERNVQLYNDAIILVTSPIIGSDAWLDIPSVGDPAAGAATGPLHGTGAVGLLTSLLGSGGAAKAEEMVENTRAFSEFLARVSNEYDARIAPTLDDVGAAADDMRAMVGEIRGQKLPAWAEAVDRVMTWATAMTEKLDAAVAEGQGVLSDTRAVIAENRPQINSAVGNIEAATGRFNTEVLDKVERVLDTGQSGLDHAAGVLSDMRIDYPGWATNINEALANANLAAQQLKLASIETRRSPWKLLYRPSSTELEHELLYEAARSFAVTAADLKAASLAVQRVIEKHGDELTGNEAAYRRLESSLIGALDRYEGAQQKLLDVLIADEQ